jgi:hypothetical protein
VPCKDNKRPTSHCSYVLCDGLDGESIALLEAGGQGIFKCREKEEKINVLAPGGVNSRIFCVHMASSYRKSAGRGLMEG